MKNQLIAALICSAALAVSCKKENNKPEPGNADDIVYLAGHQMDTITSRDVSTVWKNGIATPNSLPGGNSHYAYALTVNGNDVYSTGYENRPSLWRCQVWKNGQHQYSLGDSYSHGNGIALKGTDVYVAGRSYESTPLTNYAMLWKNNSDVSILATTNTHYTNCNAIALSGSDMYVAGSESGEAKLWKNGTAMSLTNASAPLASFTLVGVAVSGTDVYTAGYYSGAFFRVWKNGVPTDVNTNGNGFPACIAVSGNDVYVGGYEVINGKAVATYWKNGSAVHIGDNTRNSFINGMAIKGSTVYAAGDQRDANNISTYAVLWKNGALSIVGTRGSSAKAIVVK